MIEVLLFSFSISIDAFGYALGFGSRNIKLNKSEFLVINCINAIILSLLLLLYPKVNFFVNNFNFIKKISILLLFVFGIYYVIFAYITEIFFYIKKTKVSNVKKTFVKTNNFFNLYDIVTLILVFIFENAFATIMFYTCYNNVYLFVTSNFVFHYLFFLLGFDFGSKIIKKISINTSFLSGCIFIILAFINYLE